jgi:hypothetical protein
MAVVSVFVHHRRRQQWLPSSTAAADVVIAIIVVDIIIAIVILVVNVYCDCDYSSPLPLLPSSSTTTAFLYAADCHHGVGCCFVPPAAAVPHKMPNFYSKN